MLVAADVSVELSERWQCPGPVALAAFHRAGVQLIASTDSHRSETIGQYDWVRATISETDELLAVDMTGGDVRERRRASATSRTTSCDRLVCSCSSAPCR